MARPSATVFTPDGNSLVYVARNGARFGFWQVDFLTSTLRLLVPLEDTATPRVFDITPDGKRIVFEQLRYNSDIYLIDLPASR